MRVAMHVMYYWPEVGGLETHVKTLSECLVRQGHTVDVVTSRSKSGTPAFEEKNGVRLHRKVFPGKGNLGWVVTTLAALPAFWGLGRKADMMHAHDFPSIVPMLLPSWFSGTPIVATIHTSHFLRLAAKAWVRPFMGWLLRRADVLLAPSVEIADVCRELAPRHPVYAMVNAADTFHFKVVEGVLPKPRPATWRLVVPRRLYPKNGPNFALEALPLVRRQLDAELYFVGDGPMREEMEARAKALGIADFVHFLGAKPNDEMPGYLCSADLIVIPSLVEATSVAGLEAMACERVLVASDTGGLPEIVRPDTGFLARPGDVEDLAARILEAAAQPGERLAEMGRQARARVVERWSVEALTREVMVHYGEAAGKRGKKLRVES